MVAPVSSTRSRQVLYAINSDPPAAAAESDAGGNGAAFEIGSREDIDCLLNEKMKGKNKNDYKGKSEQMIEYIRKLRIGIKWFMECEDMNLIEHEKLKQLLEAEEERHSENESQMSNNLEEMNASNEELKGDNASLVERLRIEGEEKMAVMKSYDEEKSARAAAESSQNVLSEELRKAALESKCLGDEIKMLQSTKRRSEEYICSLQQFSRDLQTEVKEKGETISKLQNEKNTMVESLNMAREKQSSLKCQLEASKILSQGCP